MFRRSRSNLLILSVLYRRDSLTFPKTFGIDELAKAYFPHLFNRKENENYIGAIPPTPYYQPNGMSSDQKEKFMEWHRALKESNYVFDFQEEFLGYCRSDVDILRRCCLEFRELFRDVTDIDPFEKCLTIASACSLVYRTNFLDEDTIAVISPHGYRPDGKQSVMALKWLSYTAEKNEIYINISVMLVRNVSGIIYSMDIMKKPTQPINFMDVSGTVITLFVPFSLVKFGTQFSLIGCYVLILLNNLSIL